MNTTIKKVNKKERERLEAVARLKEWGVNDGMTIYAKVNNVSASGMSRNVGLYVSINNELIDISYWASKALEWPYKEGYNGGVRVSGCGMDMLFHTVYSLSYAMGYGSLNQTRDSMEKNKDGFIGLRYRSI